MTATKRIKVRLVNTYHGSAVNVAGELVEMGAPPRDQTNAFQPPAGYARVRVSAGQVRRAERALCGIEGCLCGHHGPSFVPDGNPAYDTTTYFTVGEVV
jgi:hypothetical protein